MLSRTMRMAFWVTYDHAGKLLLANLAAVLAFLLLMSGIAILIGRWPGGLTLIPALALGGVLFAAALAVVSFLAAWISALIDRPESRRHSLHDYLATALKHAAVLCVPMYLAVVAVVCSAWFYPVHWGLTMPWLGYPLGAIALWSGVMGILALHVLVPALTYPHPSFWRPFRIALLLTLDNPGYTVGIAAVAFLGLAISTIATPLLLVYPLFWAALTSSGYELLARKYEAAACGASAVETPDDTKDDYLNRGLQDLLFPWKG
ncbi:MAG: hypothetical protein HYV27_20215 [Candidatus Hydrogenedentes bacterium]|nr:hypothetical protein [Candidatus Hydrogenedentota bacterium]